MSRIGKKPIAIPQQITVSIEDKVIRVKGPKGELIWAYPDKIKVSIEKGTLFVGRTGESKAEKALHGLARSVIHNMVKGVIQGYQKVLEIVGVGYRAQVTGDKIFLSLGYSQPIEFQLPESVKATVDARQTTITITGIDKQLLGQVAADLKALRFPDSYKGKGIRYSGELLKIKAGKTGKK